MEHARDLEPHDGATAHDARGPLAPAPHVGVLLTDGLFPAPSERSTFCELLNPLSQVASPPRPLRIPFVQTEIHLAWGPIPCAPARMQGEQQPTPSEQTPAPDPPRVFASRCSVGPVLKRTFLQSRSGRRFPAPAPFVHGFIPKQILQIHFKGGAITRSVRGMVPVSGRNRN